MEGVKATARGVGPGTFTELTTFRAPPQVVKDCLEATAILLSDTDKFTLTDISKLMRAGPATAARVHAFDPQTMTPYKTRRLSAMVHKITPARVGKASKSVEPLATWVRCVFEYANAQHAKLSNYAVLSPGLANTPYGKLQRFQKSELALEFCWQQPKAR